VEKYNIFSQSIIIATLSIFLLFAGSIAVAAPSVTIRMIPEEETINLDVERDTRTLIARVNLEGVTYQWNLKGQGTLDGDLTARKISYIPPEAINAASVVVIISVTVTDEHSGPTLVEKRLTLTRSSTATPTDTVMPKASPTAFPTKTPMPTPSPKKSPLLTKTPEPRPTPIPTPTPLPEFRWEKIKLRLSFNLEKYENIKDAEKNGKFVERKEIVEVLDVLIADMRELEGICAEFYREHDRPEFLEKRKEIEHSRKLYENELARWKNP